MTVVQVAILALYIFQICLHSLALNAVLCLFGSALVSHGHLLDLASGPLFSSCVDLWTSITFPIDVALLSAVGADLFASDSHILFGYSIRCLFHPSTGHRRFLLGWSRLLLCNIWRTIGILTMLIIMDVHRIFLTLDALVIVSFSLVFIIFLFFVGPSLL